jgi:hypothetical protein
MAAVVLLTLVVLWSWAYAMTARHAMPGADRSVLDGIIVVHEPF